MRCDKCEKELHDCQCPLVKTYSGGKPNYTEPKEWVGLTDDEIDDIWAEFNDGYGIIEETLWGYERALEAKLKEKNG